MIFDFIKNHARIFPFEKMRKVLKVNLSRHYRRNTAAISQRLQKKAVLKEKIITLDCESKQRYGSPRIAMELNILGYKISRFESLLELA
jgi:putative transposase